MEVFVAGCIHGDWDMLVDEVTKLISEGRPIKLVLVNGDCETFRNLEDINSYSKKDEKLKKGKKIEDLLGSFYKLYNGEKKAPCLFILIGGNKECVDLFSQLPFGGFIAPNIYYTGRATVIDYKGIRISALGGNYSPKSYNQPLNIKIPVIETPLIKQAQHFRSFNIYQLLCYQDIPDHLKMHFFMTHEWPFRLPRERADELRSQLHQYPIDETFSKKLENLIKSYYGIPPSNNLIASLQPEYWTAAHLHLPFSTEIKLKSGIQTKFIANPRPKDHRKNGFKWYDIITLPQEQLNPQTLDRELSYAPEWIAILKATNENTAFTFDIKIKQWSVPLGITNKSAIQHLMEVKKFDPNILLINQDYLNPSAHTQQICKTFGITPPK